MAAPERKIVSLCVLNAIVVSNDISYLYYFAAHIFITPVIAFPKGLCFWNRSLVQDIAK